MAGLGTVKSRGGIAIVQELSVSSMPESALAVVEVDYQVPIAETASLLVRRIAEAVTETSELKTR